MDRGELSAAMIQDLGQVFAQAPGEAATTLAAADLDGIERQLQAVGRQVLGQVVAQVLAARAALPQERPPCPACGGRLRLVAQARRRDLQGLVGDYTRRRSTYHCDGCGQGHAPLDAELGLGACRWPRLLSREQAAMANGSSQLATVIGHPQSQAALSAILLVKEGRWHDGGWTWQTSRKSWWPGTWERV